ncbi:MAG: sensor histidine kinase [Sheuella sp.]|nr:sensor histidine kinase [Sheuella sp.]
MNRPINWGNPLVLLKSSLRLRLMLGTLLWISIALIAASFVLTGYFKDYASKQFQTSLQVHLDQLTTSFNVDAKGVPNLSQSLSDPRFNQPLSGLYWQINAQDGVAALRSRSLWDDIISLPPYDLDLTGIRTLTVTDPEVQTVQLLVRTITLEDQPNQKWILIVAGSTKELEHTLSDWSLRLTFFLIFLFLSLSIAAISQVMLSLSPLRSLQKSMENLRASPMSRLKGTFPQELQPLIDDFNMALDQNEQVISRARTQTGDLAHALKTPLAVLTNAAQRESKNAAGNHEFARLVSEQTAMMQRHIDWRLKRARTATTQDALHGEIEIAPVIEQLSRVMQRIHPLRTIALSVQCIPADIRFYGEIQDLQEILGNLLDNAYKWAYSKITVQVSMTGKKLTIIILDDGPGLLPEQCQQVIERGVRTDEKMPGSGLGLSIVQELVSLYQGSMELTQSADSGLCVTLKF